MREYDTTVVIQPEISEAGREALIGRLGRVLERSGAVPLEIEDIGKRRLAYEIRKFQKGHYLSLYFLDRGSAVAELERSLRLEASVLRFLTVRVEEEVADTEARVARAQELEATRKERAAERAAHQEEEQVPTPSSQPVAEPSAEAVAPAGEAAVAAVAEPTSGPAQGGPSRAGEGGGAGGEKVRPEPEGTGVSERPEAGPERGATDDRPAGAAPAAEPN